MDNTMNKHYIKIGEDDAIIDGFSDGPHSGRDTSGCILLTDHGGYQFRLHPGGEENPALWDMDGIPLYKYVDGEVLPRTEGELAGDRAAIPIPEDKPSPEEHIWEQMANAYRKGVHQA